MRRLALVLLLVALATLLGYVGLFARLAWTGLAYGRAINLTNAYVLADPDTPDGTARHARRTRLFAPLVWLTAASSDLHALPVGLMPPFAQGIPGNR